MLLKNSVYVLNTEDNKIIMEVTKRGIMDIAFSPRNTYISTYEKYVKVSDPNKPTHKNLIIYDILSGEAKMEFTQKNPKNWEVQWTEDESVVARLVNDQIEFFNISEKSLLNKFKLKGMTTFSISPGKSPFVATFVPEIKGNPASVKIYSYNNYKSPVSAKSFFRVDNIDMYWNDLGTNLLVLTHTDVDTSGTTYYGETALYFLAIAGNYDCRVELETGAPIHDVAWSPNSREFIVIYGLMPSRAILFDYRAKPVFEFPRNHRNFVKFNCHGRDILLILIFYILNKYKNMFCLAGFGNLAGEMDFWDLKTLKKIGSAQASNASYCEWCPDGQHIITATLTPRLRVDNGYKIWHYTGVKVFQEEINELYQVQWKPIAVDNFIEKTNLAPAPEPFIGGPETEVKVGVYRPPGARGRNTPSNILHKDVKTGSTEIISAKKTAAIPGYNQRKNRKKAEAKAAASNPSTPPPEPATVDPAKKLRQVQKKLREIETLKAKKASGAVLDEAQVSIIFK
ncbi:eIF2A-domain-containing protein [Piromyces finnis]|uniref:Eukaryotic translation initiation factor 2A n=1 Tax=Piromyces finnis TaxID=1754191 RepID=A0A1Y1VHF9_9FUNG|nr:eIF2A-domain-containing protein [Piromyces finnis]|eukprot:ORX56481.1 eIF2A-domain-containing protein [Piromyces finnis]